MSVTVALVQETLKPNKHFANLIGATKIINRVCDGVVVAKAKEWR